MDQWKVSIPMRWIQSFHRLNLNGCLCFYICVLGSSVSFSTKKKNKTILERFGYTVGMEIGSGSYAKVKVNEI